MKLLVFLLLLLCSIPNISNAMFVDTDWQVKAVTGKAWFADPEQIIGKQQSLYKGWAEGVFYNCDYAGQSKTYNTYTAEEFLDNKEFKLFSELNIPLTSEPLYVHRITCNGKEGQYRQVLYPFITQGHEQKAYYIFEGAIYTLEAEE